MLKRLVLLFLLIAAASFSISSYSSPQKAVYVIPYETAIIDYEKIPLVNMANMTILAINNSASPPTENESAKLLDLNMNISADCSGIHVYVGYNNEPLEAVDVSIYRIPSIPDYFEIAHGRTDASGFFSFNTTEREVGMIISKRYFQPQEMKFRIPSLNCTRGDANAQENTTQAAPYDTSLPQNGTMNETLANETENKTMNDSGYVPRVPDQHAVVSPPSEAPPENQRQTQAKSSQLGDTLLPILIIAAAIAAYLVFGGGMGKVSSGANPEPIPKPASGGFVSSGINPEPVPKPQSTGNISSGANPEPIPKPGKN